MSILRRYHPKLSAGAVLAQEPSEPVTLAEAKAHLRYTNTDKDTVIGMLISVARGKVEHMTQRSILRKSLTLRHYDWNECDPDGAYTLPLVLPTGPVESITLVQYRRSSDGAYTTLASNQYELVVENSGRSTLLPAFNVTLPTLYRSTSGGPWDAVKVDYIAGAAAASPTDVDDRLRLAILMLVAHWYENREAVLAGTISKDMEHALTTLMAQLWHGRMW